MMDPHTERCTVCGQTATSIVEEGHNCLENFVRNEAALSNAKKIRRKK